ncbi:hypothetical protein ACEU07_13685, partial [Chromobacterium violaceum]
GVNGHLTGFFDQEALIGQVRAALREDDPAMRERARRTAERYSVEQGLECYRKLIETKGMATETVLSGLWNQTPGDV